MDPHGAREVDNERQDTGSGAEPQGPEPMQGGGGASPQEHERGERSEGYMRDGDPCTIFLGGLSFDSDEGAIKRVFEEFGEVVTTKMVFDHKTGLPRGFGFVTFTTPKAAALAIKEMDGQIVDGRAIRVSKVRLNHPGPGGGYGRGDGWGWRGGWGGGRPDRARGPDRDGPGPYGRPFRGGSPGRYPGSPDRGQYRKRSRSPDGEFGRREEGDMGGPPRARGPPAVRRRTAGDDEEYPDEGERYEREEWGPREGGRPFPLRSHRQQPWGQPPPPAAGPRGPPPPEGSNPEQSPRGAPPAAGSSAPGGAPLGQGVPGGPRATGPRSAALQELQREVEAAKEERDSLSKKVAALEEALQNSNSTESFLKDRIRNLESIKKQATAQLEHRTALHNKLVLALAKLQEAQEKQKEYEKELKAIVRPLVATIQDADGEEGEPRAGLNMAHGASSAPSNAATDGGSAGVRGKSDSMEGLGGAIQERGSVLAAA